MPALTRSLMPSGEVYITETAVRAVLDQWITPSSQGSQSPLEALVLVDAFLSDPATPLTDHRREFALNEIFYAMIEHELLLQRDKLNIPSAIPRTFDEAIQQIHQDNLPGSQLLIGWSLLYHCYCRRDLNISFDEFGNQIGVVERSFRRYRSSAIRELTTLLIKKEFEARREHLSRLLVAELPISTQNVTLFGRDALQQSILQQITDKPDATILVSGGVGVGKTTFTTRILEHQIAQERLDYLVWVDSPLSLDEVFHSIAHKLKIAGAHILKEWLSIYQTAIVIDNADAVLPDLEKICLELTHALLFVICKQQVQSRFIDTLIVLKELEQSDAIKLIEHAAKRSVSASEIDLKKNADWVLRRAGGNPSAIILMLQNLAYDWEHQDGINSLFDLIFERLSPSARKLWATIALWGSGRVNQPFFSSLLDVFSSSDWDNLSRHFVCYRNDEHLMLYSIAHTYIQSIGGWDWTSLLTLFSDRLAEAPAYALELLINMFRNNVIPADDPRHEGWVDKLAAFEHTLGNTWCWIKYMDQIKISTPRILLYKARIARGRYEWQGVEGYLSDLAARIDESHPLYEEARLEEAKLLRARGHYQKALGLLGGMRKLQRASERIMNETVFEQVLIHLDLRDGEAAYKQLSTITPTDQQQMRYQFLRVNVLYELGEVDECIHQLQDLIAHVHERPALGVAYDSLGRCLMQKRDYTTAVEYFQLAGSYHDSGNALAIARSLSNLGAAYMSLNQREHALESLRQAYEIQKAIQDVVGLMVTERNLTLLRDK